MAASGFWKRALGRLGGAGAAADSESGEASTQPQHFLHEGGGGTTLAAYELGEELGRGAMAVVHLAIEKSSGRKVAIKRLALQREFAAEDLIDVRQRFMREARAAGHLQHPEILQVLDAGQAGQDAWIAMEYAPGQDLSHYTRPGTLLPVREVLALVLRLARALAYAHQQGVVHRDIKPSNVMLDRASGALKIMDFGIARIADGSRTRTGLVLGTPSFMSPEQLAGLKVDGRSDLYSLGAMLYQLLTGQLPHQSDSMATLMYQIANQAPPDVRHHRPDLPESLALVLALALEKRPELRYADGEALAQDLEAVLAQLGPAGQDPAPPGQDFTAADPFARTERLERGEPGHNP
ncbi:serine/threonine protein kinase [Roseateles sp. DAIF2]|uniref:serine/threonine-protein kinase n=1 Tax=Roseateles sp. DAIF2 TaxID=2714952 RepID=UPI0018A27B69|nr:serine/threonine-protein kinase [Roseateles sp. DAIF2]QPF76081.1 serine/threonine protein kinase [Roseateles sp. DAIF2]